MNSNTMSATPARATPCLCCACCCDHRQAVIIVDLAIIALEALVLILLPLGAFDQYVYVQDEELVKVEMIFSGVSIATGILSIFGAYIFNIWPVVVNVVWLLLGYTVGIILAVQWCKDFLEQYPSDDYYATCYIEPAPVLIQGVIMLLWIYPHIGFMVQVCKGTLSKDNYVPHSCCCVSDNSAVVGDDQHASGVVVTSVPPYASPYGSPSKMEQGVRQ